MTGFYGPRVSSPGRYSLMLDSGNNINIAPDVESERFGWTFGICKEASGGFILGAIQE